MYWCQEQNKEKIQQQEKWRITALIEFNAVTIVCEGAVYKHNCNRKSNWVSPFELQHRHFNLLAPEFSLNVSTPYI